MSAVDLFCGAGGLTYGLIKSGIDVVAGIDMDQQAEYAYSANNPGARFICSDVSRIHHSEIEALFPPRSIRLLAGCAPCQPFSKLTNGADKHRDWNLLDSFGSLVKKIRPELVTMENVPELAKRGKAVFERFLAALDACAYSFDWKIVNCAEHGVPQYRRRLVLVASKLRKISVPASCTSGRHNAMTVRNAIEGLPPLASGEADPLDPLHVASKLAPINMTRVQATPHNGGTWKSWPQHLVLPCHKKPSGKSYYSIYGRMWWGKPSPTITTLCTGLGNGRFGHPDQDRAITLREASLLQSFPRHYKFWPADKALNRKAVGRLIGNAVPPRLAMALGRAMLEHLRAAQEMRALKA